MENNGKETWCSNIKEKKKKSDRKIKCYQKIFTLSQYGKASLMQCDFSVNPVKKLDYMHFVS